MCSNCRIANHQVPFHSFREPRKIVATLVQRDLENKIKKISRFSRKQYRKRHSQGRKHRNSETQGNSTD